MQVLLSLLVTFLYTVVLFRFTPYLRDHDDLLDCGLQLCLFLLISSGFISTFEHERGSGSMIGEILGYTVLVPMFALMTWGVLISLCDSWGKHRAEVLTGGAPASAFDAGLHPSAVLTLIQNADEEFLQQYRTLRKRILDSKSDIGLSYLWQGLYELVEEHKQKRGELNLEQAAKRIADFIQAGPNLRIVHNFRLLMDKSAFDLVTTFVVLHATDTERVQVAHLCGALARALSRSQSTAKSTSDAAPKGADADELGKEVSAKRRASVALAKTSDHSIRKSVGCLDRIASTVARFLKAEVRGDPELLSVDDISSFKQVSAVQTLQKFVRARQKRRPVRASAAELHIQPADGAFRLTLVNNMPAERPIQVCNFCGCACVVKCARTNT